MTTSTAAAAAAESSSMDDTDTSNGGDNHRQNHPQSLTRAVSATTTTTDRHNSNSIYEAADSFADDDDEGEENSETWSALKQSFKQVQTVLDRNRLLIQQVNENHQSKNHENLVKNVELIQEINGNISKVVSLYSDLSANFSWVFHQQNPPKSDN